MVKINEWFSSVQTYLNHECPNYKCTSCKEQQLCKDKHKLNAILSKYSLEI